MLRRADVPIHEADVRQGAAAVAESHDIGIAVSRNLFSALNIALTLAFVGAVYVPVRRIGEGDPLGGTDDPAQVICDDPVARRSLRPRR